MLFCMANFQKLSIISDFIYKECPSYTPWVGARAVTPDTGSSQDAAFVWGDLSPFELPYRWGYKRGDCVLIDVTGYSPLQTYGCGGTRPYMCEYD